eukprot:TRINITY_DN1628_c0_g1_i1.p1 TRINITY_DN1628_c0_g1~~TRINITY_DN1628_c0_g1_i1.p1  ORF type:complete len:770 (-),score=77.51 TRINITY_DN1628_c0_g1_i1:363-2672(-)
MKGSRNSTEDSSSEEDDQCPMCMEELDITDRSFKPCQCGYQMCRFCWHHIKENLNSKCPACRQPYDPEKYTFNPPDPKDLKMSNKKKKTNRVTKKKPKESPTQPSSNAIEISRKNLTNVRVIQRNLVYITNLALSLAKEDLLNSDEYFGRFGKITKIVVNKNNLYNVNSPGGPSVSAYVTYDVEDDARMAIESLDGSWLGGRTLRASFGTTKYCTFFLKGVTCTNPDCLYLHALGGDNDSFTKEEMGVGKSNFYDQIHPNSLGKTSALEGSTSPPDNSDAPPGLSKKHRARTNSDGKNAALRRSAPAPILQDKKKRLRSHSNSRVSALPANASWGKRNHVNNTDPSSSLPTTSPTPPPNLPSKTWDVISPSSTAISAAELMQMGRRNSNPLNSLSPRKSIGIPQGRHHRMSRSPNRIAHLATSPRRSHAALSSSSPAVVISGASSVFIDDGPQFALSPPAVWSLDKHPTSPRTQPGPWNDPKVDETLGSQRTNYLGVEDIISLPEVPVPVTAGNRNRSRFGFAQQETSDSHRNIDSFFGSSSAGEEQMQSNLRKLLPNVNISFSNEAEEAHAAEDVSWSMKKLSISPILNHNPSPWSPLDTPSSAPTQSHKSVKQESQSERHYSTNGIFGDKRSAQQPPNQYPPDVGHWENEWESDAPWVRSEGSAQSFMDPSAYVGWDYEDHPTSRPSLTNPSAKVRNSRPVPNTNIPHSRSYSQVPVRHTGFNVDRTFHDPGKIVAAQSCSLYSQIFFLKPSWGKELCMICEVLLYR